MLYGVLWLLSLYHFVLLARVVLDFVQIFARSWEPKGFVLIAANLVYRLTDPPLRFLGRFIPPIRLGMISLDVGFLVLFVGLLILQRIVIFGIG
ncbi:YggT family protein [Arcanobacterium hippocoleae]|uniref:YggT family protein n=1 Tax=Arcanobacterium hippocoleae TaxID=149017 RepID=UPI00286D0126|nr:YggT family protein [Arcanobacterium hippocoleae]